MFSLWRLMRSTRSPKVIAQGVVLDLEISRQASTSTRAVGELVEPAVPGFGFLAFDDGHHFAQRDFVGRLDAADSRPRRRACWPRSRPL